MALSLRLQKSDQFVASLRRLAAARRRCAGVPRRDAFSMPRIDGTAAVNAASSRRQGESFGG